MNSLFIRGGWFGFAFVALLVFVTVSQCTLAAIATQKAMEAKPKRKVEHIRLLPGDVVEVNYEVRILED